MSTNSYKCELKSAPMSSEFGLNYAMKVFKKNEEEFKSLCGTYKRDTKYAKIGDIKGWINWYKVVKGGWCKTGAYDFEAGRGCGFVVKNGITFNHRLSVYQDVVLSNEHPDDFNVDLKEKGQLLYNCEREDKYERIKPNV